MDNKQYSTRELFRRFAPYFKKYRFTLWMDLFCAALTTVCELVLPLIMRYITNEGLRDLASLSVKTILSLGVLYFGLRIVDCIASYYMSDMGHVMGAKIETDMRRDAYNHLQKLSNTYYNNTKVGQIMGRITNDLFDVTEFAHHCPEEFFIAGIKTVISFIILANINLPLTLMIFLCVPLMCGVCMILNFRMRSAFRKQRNQIGELNARIEDSLLGHKVVKAFTNEEVENVKFEKDNGTFLDIKKLTYRYMAAFNTTVKLFDGLMYLVVLVAGGIFMVNGRIAAGDLVAYMLYVSTLIATIRRIIEFAEQFQRGMTGIERFLQIVDADIEIFDEPDAIELKDPKGEISFEKVSFEYPDDHNKVFTDLNLQIHAGEKVAIVGPSGGGKTTLCNLIPRFYDVSEGRILLDGQDIKHFTLKSLRGNIGIVQQDVYLFSGTIYENISGTNYATCLYADLDVQITDAFSPFLYPNQYVNFTADSKVVAKGQELAEGASSDLEVITRIYDYITQNITYDYDKASDPPTGYTSDVDAILASGTGICLDYAAVMASMLRSQRIPTRLEVGYAQDAYHAWISVYTADTGWLNGIIEFDGNVWTLVDPTFGANTDDKTLKKFIGDGSNYILQKMY